MPRIGDKTDTSKKTLTSEELLDTPDISEFLNHNDNTKEAAGRAATVLENEHDAVVALKRVLPALSEKVIPVFFSYKKKDEDTATAVVQTLRRTSAKKLDITYQAEFTEEVAGKLWRDKIREAVQPANWFILLLPDPSDDWDWCLFETGLFVARRSSADRLICLHHPDTKIPSQIEDYHAVAAEQSEVEKFLRMVYILPDAVPGMEPLNPDIEESIPAIAKEIVDSIRPPRKDFVKDIFEPRIALNIEDPDSLASKKGLDLAKVIDANQSALELFGFLKKPETFGKLREEILEPDEDSRWRKELCSIIPRIANGKAFAPVQAVFKASDGRIIRPVVFAAGRVGDDGPIETIHISFIEEIAAVDRSSMPANLSMLADLLRFTFRFRWEVLEPFSKTPITDKGVKRLDRALGRLKSDWDSRHVGDDKDLFAMFNEEHQVHFAEMAEQWTLISNDDRTGKLDLAIESGDKKKIPPMLKEFLPKNQEFLEIAAERFSELISKSS